MKLNSASQIPLYHQLKQIIIEDIESGKYEVGEQLPTEIELCENYNVSRITVRRAISDLVKEKVLYRKQGKGTFVSEHKIIRELVSMGSFSDITIQSGKKPSTQILSNQTIKPDKKLREIFKIKPDNDVLELKRLLSIDRTPFIIETSYYPVGRFPDLEHYINSNNSTYKILREHYNIDIMKAEKTIDVRLTNQEESKIFDCDPNSIMYLVNKIAYDTNDEAIHVSSSLFLASKVTFTLTVNNDETENREF